MARWKVCATGGPPPRSEVTGGACAAHVSRLAAAALVRKGAPAHCYRVLAALLPYWKEKTSSEYYSILSKAININSVTVLDTYNFFCNFFIIFVNYSSVL